jgi:hypothetical protein
VARGGFRRGWIWERRRSAAGDWAALFRLAGSVNVEAIGVKRGVNGVTSAFAGGNSVNALFQIDCQGNWGLYSISNARPRKRNRPT